MLQEITKKKQSYSNSVAAKLANNRTCVVPMHFGKINKILTLAANVRYLFFLDWQGRLPMRLWRLRRLIRHDCWRWRLLVPIVAAAGDCWSRSRHAFVHLRVPHRRQLLLNRRLVHRRRFVPDAQAHHPEGYRLKQTVVTDS